MAAFLQKNWSIDAQMRLLVPKKVSEDDKLVDYGGFLLDRFLKVLESLHGKEVKETVREFIHHFSVLFLEERVDVF